LTDSPSRIEKYFFANPITIDIGLT